MESVQLIYIRADGNEAIAAGHLMRCLTIARVLQTKGHRVCFLVSDTNSTSILTANEPSIISVTSDRPFSDDGIGVLQLQHADYCNPETEIDEVAALLQLHPGIMLIDSYFVTDTYLRHLQTLTKIAYIDDICAFDYPVDLLINYDCFTDSMKTEFRRNVYTNAAMLLLGAEYAPLRSQFFNQKINIQNEAKNVFVTTGSSDPCHFAMHFCQKLLDEYKHTAINYHIIVGSLNTDYENLEVIAKKLPNIRLHKDLTDLMPLMTESDLAVTAGGTTLYELCALGIPSVSFSMADNQISTPKILNELDIVPYAGDIRTQMDSVLKCCMNFITEYAPDYEKRKTAHIKMNSLISGDGALRIADAILNLK